MTLIALLIRLRACGVHLTASGEKLRVSVTPGLLTKEDQQAMAEHKEALKNLPHPYLNAAGELIVPFNAPPQYHWQSKAQTLHDVMAFSKIGTSTGENDPHG